MKSTESCKAKSLLNGPMKVSVRASLLNHPRVGKVLSRCGQCVAFWKMFLLSSTSHGCYEGTGVSRVGVVAQLSTWWLAGLLLREQPHNGLESFPRRSNAVWPKNNMSCARCVERVGVYRIETTTRVEGKAMQHHAKGDDVSPLEKGKEGRWHCPKGGGATQHHPKERGEAGDGKSQTLSRSGLCQWSCWPVPGLF